MPIRYTQRNSVIVPAVEEIRENCHERPIPATSASFSRWQKRIRPAFTLAFFTVMTFAAARQSQSIQPAAADNSQVHKVDSSCYQSADIIEDIIEIITEIIGGGGGGGGGSGNP